MLEVGRIPAFGPTMPRGLEGLYPKPPGVPLARRGLVKANRGGNFQGVCRVYRRDGLLPGIARIADSFVGVGGMSHCKETPNATSPRVMTMAAQQPVRIPFASAWRRKHYPAGLLAPVNPNAVLAKIPCQAPAKLCGGTPRGGCTTQRTSQWDKAREFRHAMNHHGHAPLQHPLSLSMCDRIEVMPPIPRIFIAVRGTHPWPFHCSCDIAGCAGRGKRIVWRALCYCECVPVRATPSKLDEPPCASQHVPSRPRPLQKQFNRIT